jgi:hypothetical protein
MKVYRDLVFRGSRPALDRFMADIEQRLTDGWARYHARENEVRRAALGPMYCFSCTTAGQRPASELWVATQADGALYVSNVLASERSSLTYDQYNAIVQEFHDRFALPAAQAAGVEVEIGKADPQIEDFLSEHTARLLRSFSALANRSMLHPLDRERWNQFLTGAHREGAPLSASMLKRWLIEDEGWAEDEAVNLAIEYEHARNLLEVFESRLA